jgi:hypothetical protein
MVLLMLCKSYADHDALSTLNLRCLFTLDGLISLRELLANTSVE